MAPHVSQLRYGEMDIWNDNRTTYPKPVLIPWLLTCLAGFDQTWVAMGEDRVPSVVRWFPEWLRQSQR
jgi:hypothetical protein